MLILALPVALCSMAAGTRSARWPPCAVISPRCSQSIAAGCTRRIEQGMKAVFTPSAVLAPCRVRRCGVMTCQCEPAPTATRTPWGILELNLSSALDPNTVQHAFCSRAELLRPDRNSARIHCAATEFIVARRARDVLLSLAAVSAMRDEAEVDYPDETGGPPSVSHQAGRQTPILLTVFEWLKRAFTNVMNVKWLDAGGADRSSRHTGWWGWMRASLRELIAEAARGIDFLRISVSKLSMLLFLASVILMSIEV